MIRTFRTGLTAAIATSLLALTACGDSSPADGSTDSAAMDGDDVATDAAASAKLSKYTEGYNKLIGTFGLPSVQEDYVGEDVMNTPPTDTINVTDGWLEQGINLLKEARALPGDDAELDAAGDALVAALEPALTHIRALNIYYDSKAYREDNLERGRAEDAQMKAELETAMTALDDLSDVIDVRRAAQMEMQLAAYQEDGNMLGYHTAKAMQQAGNLLALFTAPEDMEDAAIIAKADAIVKEMETTLAAQREVFAKAKQDAASPADEPDSDYAGVADELTSMIGDYRDMKVDADVDDLNGMIDEYNSAVDDSNSIDG